MRTPSAGIDLMKTWTMLENEGQSEGLINNISTLGPGPPPAPSIVRGSDLPPAGVVEVVSAWLWSRRLATNVIKSITYRGRVNAARKRNQELVAAGTPVSRGRLPKTREARSSALVPPQRPQALFGKEIDRLYNDAATTKSRGVMSRADAIM